MKRTEAKNYKFPAAKIPATVYGNNLCNYFYNSFLPIFTLNQIRGSRTGTNQKCEALTLPNVYQQEV